MISEILWYTEDVSIVTMSLTVAIDITDTVASTDLPFDVILSYAVV